MPHYCLDFVIQDNLLQLLLGVIFKILVYFLHHVYSLLLFFYVDVLNDITK